MDPIIVPRPKSVRDPNRPVSTLLLAQVKHLREAEKSLPPRYNSGIFSHAIQTEGEAASYVQAVTEAIHRAHDDAVAARVRRARKPKREEVISIAAVADETAEAEASTGRSKKKNSTSKRKG